jgi:hypothetical protein
MDDLIKQQIKVLGTRFSIRTERMSEGSKFKYVVVVESQDGFTNIGNIIKLKYCKTDEEAIIAMNGYYKECQDRSQKKQVTKSKLCNNVLFVHYNGKDKSALTTEE